MSDPDCYLGVTRSFTGRRWIGPSLEVARASEALSQSCGLPVPVCQVLARLDIAPGAVPDFLAPRLKDLLPDPHALKDMENAASRFLQAVQRQERIAIFADYDVDGGASAALLIRWLRGLGLTATLYVPDRIAEGYGPNPQAMQMLGRDHDLIVCVDCGTLSHEALAVVGEADVIVLDHHLGGETLPRAVAVVNPNRQDEPGDLAHLCAAAVVFLLLVETNRQMRSGGRTGPDLMALLDLVALATVADVAPLIGVNRAFVRQGLVVAAARRNVGLVALSDVARLDTAPTAYHLGFVLGPRINAGGRVGKADLGARLLASESVEEAQGIAARLEAMNTERRDIEARVRLEAMVQAEARGLDGPLVWAAGEGWHPGVVGIVAARLKEMTNRPAVVIGLDGETGKGSGRSVSGIDLGAAVQRLAGEGLLLTGGGHRMAAGLSLERDRIETSMARLGDLLARQGTATLGPRDLKLDGLLMPGAATTELVGAIDAAGPFGASVPSPRFAIPDALIHDARRVGDAHLKLTLSDGAGPRLDAICFGAFEGELGRELERLKRARAHIAGRLEINTWNGRSRVQIRLEDAAPS